MHFPNGVMVTVESTSTTTDELGNSTTATVLQAWGPCAVGPRYAQESADPNVAPTVVGKVVYGPLRTLDQDDVIVICGERFQVDGLPGEWVNPFSGWGAGMEVPIKRTA